MRFSSENVQHAFIAGCLFHEIVENQEAGLSLGGMTRKITFEVFGESFAQDNSPFGHLSVTGLIVSIVPHHFGDAVTKISSIQ